MAIDPARLGLAVVMLSRRRPMLNLFAFWVGGMVAGVGIALAVLVFMRDVALAAIQGVVSAANEFREAVGILAGGRLHIVIGVIMLLLAARMVARARAQVGVPVGPVGVADGGMSALALAQRPPGLVARLEVRTQQMLQGDVVWPAFVVGVASSAPPFESVVALTVIMASGAEIGTQFGAFVVFTLLVLATTTRPTTAPRSPQRCCDPETACCEMSLASASTETTTNVWKSRAADLFSSYMVMIGCSPEPCRHSADVLRIPVSEWLSPPDGWRATTSSGNNGTAGSIPVSASCATATTGRRWSCRWYCTARRKIGSANRPP